jgi:hypothetical protein
MAKKQSTIQTAERKLEGFTEDLSRLLGDAKSKAEGWIGQRKHITEYLAGIQDTAASLLNQLGVGEAPRRGRKRGRPRKASTSGAAESQPGPSGKAGRKRTMSREARARISAAQKRRWAKLRREENN